MVAATIWFYYVCSDVKSECLKCCAWRHSNVLVPNGILAPTTPLGWLMTQYRCIVTSWDNCCIFMNIDFMGINLLARSGNQVSINCFTEFYLIRVLLFILEIIVGWWRIMEHSLYSMFSSDEITVIFMSTILERIGLVSCFLLLNRNSNSESQDALYWMIYKRICIKKITYCLK